jgi:hypothetical protein
MIVKTFTYGFFLGPHSNALCCFRSPELAGSDGETLSFSSFAIEDTADGFKLLSAVKAVRF